MQNNRMTKTLLGLILILAAAIMPAARVIRPPAKGEGLAARWQWAREQLRKDSGGGPALIVYAVDMGDLEHHCNRTKKSGQTLGSCLGLMPEKKGENRTFFLFRFSEKTNGKNMEGVRLELADNDSEAPAGKAPIYFLGTFSTAESTTLLKGFFARVKALKPAQKLLLAMAIHPNHDAVVPFLIRVAQRDDRPKIRRKAVFWLGLHPTDRAVQFLETILTSKGRDDAPRQAVESLGLNRHARATAVLLNLAAGDRRQAVRHDALFWLSNKVRQKMRAGMRNTESKDSSRSMRVCALTALAQIPGDSAGDKLAALARSSADPHLRGEAVFWLAQREDPRVLPIMKGILDPEKSPSPTG